MRVVMALAEHVVVLHHGEVIADGAPDAVTREAYSHEVSSAGFWPGGGGVEEELVAGMNESLARIKAAAER